jgi:hypothetical protein
MTLTIADSYEEDDEDLDLLMNFNLNYALGVACNNIPKRPFIELYSWLDISVSSMTVDGWAILLGSDQIVESRTVHLTAALEGIHMMNSYFNYLQEKFYDINCDQGMNHYGAGVWFMGCYCDGNDYAGTPDL